MELFRDNLGIGISVYYTNSGLSSSTDSWKPENAIEGYEPEIPDVKPPELVQVKLFMLKDLKKDQ